MEPETDGLRVPRMQRIRLARGRAPARQAVFRLLGWLPRIGPGPRPGPFKIYGSVSDLSPHQPRERDRVTVFRHQRKPALLLPLACVLASSAFPCGSRLAVARQVPHSVDHQSHGEDEFERRLQAA